jgi:hypothetical protein
MHPELPGQLWVPEVRFHDPLEVLSVLISIVPSTVIPPIPFVSAGAKIPKTPSENSSPVT